MAYSDIDPMPEVPRPQRARWLVAALLMGWVSVPLSFVTSSPWIFACWLPFAVVAPVWTVRSVRRHKAYMRAADEWSERMRAYYAQGIQEARDRAQRWRYN